MKLIIDDTKLTNIADSLRNKLNTDEEFTPDDMADAIENISGGVDGQYISFVKSEGSDVIDTAVYNGFEKVSNAELILKPILIFENGTEEIGFGATGSALGQNNVISKIILPNSLISLKPAAFKGCKALKDIVIPELITTISEQTFYECTGLTKVIIPNSVNSIERAAFKGCTSITKIFIPSSVSSIPYYELMPFYNCSSSLEIYTDAVSKPSGWASNFNNYSSTGKLTVHYGVSREEFNEIIESEEA